MDQEVIDGARQAVAGLLVLAAIPVVLYALWAEYFKSYIETLTKTTPDFDRKAEMEKAKTASICVLLFEVVLFVGSIDLLKIYPKTCSLVLLGATFALGVVQAGLEKAIPIPAQQKAGLKLVSPEQSSEPYSKQLAVQNANALKALFFGLLGGLSYMFTMIAVVKIFAWIAEFFKFSNSAGAVFVMVGAALGIFAGLLLNFALAPWQMKNSLPVSKLEEGELLTKLSSVFSRAKHFDFYIVEVEIPRSATAMVAGFARGIGAFRPAVFISRSLIKQLNDRELTAVIAHEAAHVERAHLAKRLGFSGALIVGLTFLCVFAILAVHAFFPVGEWQGSSGSIFGFIALVTTFRALSWQSKRHETEADFICVSKDSNRFDDWASALRKIDAFNGIDPKQVNSPGLIRTLFGQGHLPTEVRIAEMKILLAKSNLYVSDRASENTETDQAA